jgi:hypothetical protein
MISAAIKLKWDGFFRKLLNGASKRQNDRLIQSNSAQERSISILQKRYGYTREQAGSELKKHYSKAWLG